MTVTLLLIDAQNSFHPGGSLAIPKADEDANRIADLIRSKNSKIDHIVATLDSHHKLHIGHPSFWVNDDGRHPDPFTIITTKDIESGVWKPRPGLKIYARLGGGSSNPSPSSIPDDMILDVESFEATGGNAKTFLPTDPSPTDLIPIDLTQYCIQYSQNLSLASKLQICIWPEHCIIGTPGHNLVSTISSAIDHWVETSSSPSCVEYIMKGQNVLTEMYSVMKADVPVTPETRFNEALVKKLVQSDKVVVAGQAMSHCVNYTVRDLMGKWPKGRRGDVVLLTDCCSAVPGFEAVAKEFLGDMKKLGMTLCTAREFLEG